MPIAIATVHRPSTRRRFTAHGLYALLTAGSVWLASLQGAGAQMRPSSQDTLDRMNDYNQRLQEQRERAAMDRERQQAEAAAQQERYRQQMMESQRQINQSLQETRQELQDGWARGQQRQMEEMERRHEQRRAAAAEEQATGSGSTTYTPAPRPAAPSRPVRATASTSAAAAPAARWAVGGLPSGETLNLRAGPGMTYPVVGTLANGDSHFIVTGPKQMNGSTDWYPVKVAGQTGYLRGKFLRKQ